MRSRGGGESGWRRWKKVKREEEIKGGWKIYRYRDAKDLDKKKEEEETDESH